jgi:hypothetical protein
MTIKVGATVALVASLATGCFAAGENSILCARACRPQPLQSYRQDEGACVCRDVDAGVLEGAPVFPSHLIRDPNVK